MCGGVVLFLSSEDCECSLPNTIGSSWVCSWRKEASSMGTEVLHPWLNGKSSLECPNWSLLLTLSTPLPFLFGTLNCFMHSNLANNMGPACLPCSLAVTMSSCAGGYKLQSWTTGAWLPLQQVFQWCHTTFRFNPIITYPNALRKQHFVHKVSTVGGPCLRTTKVGFLK